MPHAAADLRTSAGRPRILCSERYRPAHAQAGTYWITVDDPLDSHNFELRSCPGATAPCGPGQGAEQELTPVCNDDPANPDLFKCGTNTETAANDIVKTVKIVLKHGTYRLFCDAQQPVVHESAGMYIDIEVGGVGQVG